MSRFGAAAGAGLCDQCAHQRIVGTVRSLFSMCLRSKGDDRYPKYPHVPVIRCDGFEERHPGG